MTGLSQALITFVRFQLSHTTQHANAFILSGRILGQASAAANLADPANAATKAAAVSQAHATLMAATGTTADTLAA